MNYISQRLSLTVATTILNFATIITVSQPCNSMTLDTAVLDQEFIEPINLGANINEGFTFVGQTYTAGLTGTLSGVNINVHSFNDINTHKVTDTFPLRVSIYEVSQGIPTSNILGETILNSSSASLNDLITFSQTIPQMINQQYAIIVNYFGAPPSGAGQGIGIWNGRAGNEYLKGQLIFSNNTTQWRLSEHDVFFRTFVTPHEKVSVPEYSSVLSLLVFGALGSSLVLKKFKNSHVSRK